MFVFAAALAFAAAEPAPAPPPSSPSGETATSAPADAGKLVEKKMKNPMTSVAVDQLELVDLPPHWGPLLSHALTAELRKLQHTRVVSTDEIRDLLQHEADRQATSCEASTNCLAEIGDALGVDVLVTGGIARIGDERLFTLKRMATDGQAPTQQVTRRFAMGSGEELLGAIGPAVAELFPDETLKKGAVRGVDLEVARRLNPPPLKPWVAITGVVTTGVLALAAGASGVLNAVLVDASNQYKDGPGTFVTSTFDEKASAADAAAVFAWVSGGAAITIGIATGVAALFTDFDEAPAPSPSPP